MESGGTYNLLPAYLVLDSSNSMSVGGAFDAAFAFLPQMLAEMQKSSVVAEKLRVEVLTFDESARVVFPLGTRDSLEEWLKEKAIAPIRPTGDATKYGDAFIKLRTEIEEGVRRIRAESYNGEAYRAYRPVVFFITDGEPNDAKSSRDAAFSALTTPLFAFRPNIVCVGVGKASFDDLKPYGAGRYGIEDGKYTVGNTNFVLISRDGVSPAAALSTIIPSLVQSLVSSIGSTQNAATEPDSDGIVDPVGGMEMDDESGLFGEMEDFDALFESHKDFVA